MIECLDTLLPFEIVHSHVPSVDVDSDEAARMTIGMIEPMSGSKFLHEPNELRLVTVIIPARNAEASLPKVLRDLPAVGAVIVVDNDSSDKTSRVAVEHGATVVRAAEAGFGNACFRGLAEIRESILTGGAAPRVVAFLNADYSDFPELLPSIVTPILDGRADLVLGSRVLDEREVDGFPRAGALRNRWACWLMRRLYRTRYTDIGPFRAIDYALLGALGLAERGAGWAAEMQIKAADAKLRTVEIPVPYRRPIGHSADRGTLLGAIRAAVKTAWLIGKCRLQRSRSLRSDAKCAVGG